MRHDRVLVTGAGGFIGRWSVPPLLARGYEVHAAVGRRDEEGRADRDRERCLSGARRYAVDLLDTAAMRALLAAIRPTHLLHFAWIATPGLYAHSAENARWLEASIALLQAFAAGGGGRAVVAGSCAEYDWSRVAVCDERLSPLADETAGGGATPYAACKLELQRALTRVGAAQGMSAAWGRTFFQYGPGEHPQRLVSSVILALLAGREAPCTHGRQIRSFLHVADVGAAFAALLDRDVEGAVNIGSARRVTLIELLESIADQIGRRDLLRFGARAAPASEPPLLVPALERLTDEVGWRPTFDLPGGIADSIAWWRAQ